MQPYRSERLRRLSRRPAAGHERRARTSSSWRRSSRPARGRRTTTTSATCTRGCCQRDARRDERQPRLALQGRELRHRARRPGRAPTARATGLTITRDNAFGVPHVYGTTRAGRDVRPRLRRRRGPPVLHRRPAPRRPRRAQLVRRRRGGQPPAWTREQWALAPYTEADLQRQADQLDDLYGDEGRAAAGRRGELRRGRQQVHRRGAGSTSRRCPASTPRSAGRSGPDPWKVTDIIATASLVGGIFGKGGGGELTQMELRQRRSSRATARGAGERLWREWAAYEDADAPTTVRGRRFPYQTPPKQPARGGIAIADAGSLRRDERRRRDGRRAAPRGARRARDGAARAGLLPPRRRACPTRCSSSRRGVGQRQAARRLRPADRLLLAADPHGAGRPRAGHRRARRGVPGREPLRPARPRPGLLVERDVGRPGHHRHVRASISASPAARAPTTRLDALPSSAASACRSRCSSATNRWSPTLADATPRRQRDAARASARSSASSSGRATISGKPVAYTRLRSTYMHEIDSALGFSDFNDPDEDARRARLPARGARRSATRSTGSTSTTATSRTSTRATTRSARAGVTGQLPMPARAASGAASTPSAAPPPTRRSPSTRRRSTASRTSRRGTTSRRAATRARTRTSSPRSSARRCSTRRSRRGSPARAKIDLPGLVEAMGEAATTDLRAEQVLPLALQVIGTPARSESSPTPSPSCATWVADGLAPARPRRRRRATSTPRRSASSTRSGRAGCAPSSSPRWATELFDQLERRARARQRRPTTAATTWARPTRTGWYGYAAKDLRRVLGRQGARAVLQALLRRRPARALPDRAARRAARRAGRTADPATLYADDAVQRRAGKPRRPGLLRRDRLPPDRRRHPADDRLAEPARPTSRRSRSGGTGRGRSCARAGPAPSRCSAR